MQDRKRRNKSQAALVGIVLATLLVLAMLDLQTWQQSRQQQGDEPRPAAQTPGDVKSVQPQPNIKVDGTNSYAGWQIYRNADYGLSFKYPQEWEMQEASIAPSSGYVTRPEYAITLTNQQDRGTSKYRQTASFEVLAQPMTEVEAMYDNQFTQASASSVTKNAGQLKGKGSVQYKVIASGAETKLYLFEVKGKTYVFSSINEESNLSRDPQYWSKFDKVFASLEL